MSDASHNVDAAELDKFGSLAAQWWDPQGPFKTLHAINALRVDYIAARAALQNARVLDVGCGGGILAEALARHGARVIGTDLAPANLEAAAAHAAAAGLAIDYRLVDVADLARAEPQTFDIVTCLELLEHVPDPESVIAACAMLAKPGAAVFFSTINRNLKVPVSRSSAPSTCLGAARSSTHEYAKLVRPAELGAACRAAGLDLQELMGLHFNPLQNRYTLGGNVDVNYLAYAVKRGSS
jgi:2-polyprenyl-6-hydroxyphenyl methylase/3-demethylubiquinone-9 3-methyltransferase